MFEDTRHFFLHSVCVRNTSEQPFTRLALDPKAAAITAAVKFLFG